jgi:hypothetical protein
MWARRSKFAVGYVSLALVVLVTACTPSDAKIPFTPGTWSDDATHESVTLNADGSGSAMNVPYLVREGRGYCLPNEAYLEFAGQVRWRWDNDKMFIYLDMPDARRSGFAFVGAWRPDDWSKLGYWACGPLDGPGNLVMERDPGPSSHG